MIKLFLPDSYKPGLQKQVMAVNLGSFPSYCSDKPYGNNSLGPSHKKVRQWTSWKPFLHFVPWDFRQKD